MKKIYLFVLLFICCDDPNQSGQQEDFIPIDEYFIYNESNMIAFYFFENITIDGVEIDSLDWVAAFNGQVCVGAKQWNCVSQTCDIAVYGENTLNDLTTGYMQSGQLPTFKVYDYSDSVYYDAQPSEEILWNNGDFNQIEALIAN